MAKINKLFVPYVIFLIILGIQGQLLLAFLIVFFHEIIHCIAAYHFNISAYEIELIPIGAVLKFNELDSASPYQDIIISISAPSANLILALVFYIINLNVNKNIIHTLYQYNMIIGLFNLIPALPLDGGRILRDIFRLNILYKRANMYAVNISIIIGIMLMAIYFFLFFLGFNNINIGIISVFIIISSYKEKERIVYLIMGDIIKKKYNFLKNGYIENKSISITYRWNLINIMNIVEKNKYNIFLVLDDDMKVVATIYEEEIIEALKQYGNISLKEFIEIRGKTNTISNC